MRMTKTIIAMTAALAVTVAYAGDSAPFLLDMPYGTRVAQDVESIAYSTAWDNGTSVRVAVDGVTLKEAAAPASGNVAWNAAKAGKGLHTLTHTTYANGVAGKVETATFQVSSTSAPVTSELEVTDIVAKQRYPWNGMVDITCKVTGIDGTPNGLEFAVAAVMPDTGNALSASRFWVVRGGTNSTDREVHANGDYRLLWDARTDLGQVNYSNMVVRITIRSHSSHDKVQLWKGGPYWATTNIGAEKPEDYGYYFWWGDTVGYKRENGAWVASDGSSSVFSFSSGNVPNYNKSIDTLHSEGWITAGGALAPEHDAAQVHWGGGWRMPTEQELSDLNDKCDRTWSMMNGVFGYLVCGRGDYASASIFLPAAGFGDETSLYDAGSGGYFWSSVPYSGYNDACYLYFHSSGHYTYSNRYRDYGQSVRPVQGFTE